MRVNVDMQDCAMRVSQSRLRLCDMPVPGSVYQQRVPDSTGRDANQGECGGENGKGGGEAQLAAGKSKRGRGTTHNAGVNGDKGAKERLGQVFWEQGDGDATGGRRGDGGRYARI